MENRFARLILGCHCVLTLQFAASADVGVSLEKLFDNQVSLRELGTNAARGAAPAPSVDLTKDPAGHVEELKQDLRDGQIGRIQLWGPRLLQLRPQDGELQALSAIQAAASAQTAKARDHLAQAKKLAPKSALPLFAEALILRVEGKPKESLALCAKAADLERTHPYGWNLQGRAHSDLGQWTNAAASFQRAIELNKDFSPAYGNLGSAAFMVGDYPRAWQAFETALRFSPNDAFLRYGRAQVQEAMGDTAKALEELQAGLNVDPKNALVLQKLAELQVRLGQVDPAIETGKRMKAEALPSAPLFLADAYLQKGDLAAAYAQLNQAPTNSAHRYHLTGYYFLLKKRYADAVTSMEQALKVDPNHFGAFVGRAVAKLLQGTEVNPATELTGTAWPAGPGLLLKFIEGSVRGGRGDWPGALAQFNAAEGFVPGFSMVGIDAATLAKGSPRTQWNQLDLAVLYYLKNLTEPAVGAIQALLAAGPDWPLANYWAGAILLKKGDRAKALTHFEKATKTAPNFFAALYAAGELQFTAGKPDQAADFYRRAQGVKADAGVSLRLGLYYEHKGQLDAAEKEYRQLIQLSPNFYVAYNQLAWFLGSRGQKLDEALQLAKKADSLQPGNASVLDTLGWIYAQKRQYDQALDHVQRAIAASPSNPSIWYHLGVVQRARNDAAEAKKALEKALALSDRFDEVADAKKLLKELK